MVVLRTRWLTPLVVLRRRPDRRKLERTCTCDAVGYPHRAGSVDGCYGLSFCEHGRPTPDHPDYEGRCPECDRWAWADMRYHALRDEGRI
jgi:hypothetical protein